MSRRIKKTPYTILEEAFLARSPHSIFTEKDEITYFIRAGKLNVVKIEKSTISNLEDRLSDLQTGNHEELKILCISSKLEVYYHTKFDKYKIRGEWFELSKEVIEEVHSILMNQSENQLVRLLNINYKTANDFKFNDLIK